MEAVRIRRRRRPALSCLNCRRRKIKCDRNDPCVHCTSAKLQCKYAPPTRDAPAVRSLAPRPTRARTSVEGGVLSPSTSATPTSRHVPLNERPDPFEGLAQIYDANNGGSVLTQDVSGSGSIREASARRGGPQSIASAQEVVLSDHRPANGAGQTQADTFSEVSRPVAAQKTSLWDSKDFEPPPDEPSVAKAHKFDAVMRCFIQASRIDETSSQPVDADLRVIYTDIMHLLGECKREARRLKAPILSQSLPTPELDLVLPSKQDAGDMAMLYFQSFESTYRIFHQPSFWTEYRRFWDAPEQAPPSIRLKICLIVAIGSSIDTTGKLDRGFRGMIQQWVHAAEAWLSGSTEKYRHSISAVQIHCLMILVRQIFSIGGDLVWISVGSLIPRAMHLSLHRDPKYLRPMNSLQSEQRRRLWATVLELTLQTALDSGMPPNISTKDFDTEPPSNIDDADISDDIEAQPCSYPRHVMTRTSLQLMLLDSFPTRLKMLQSLNSLHAKISYTTILELDAELTESRRRYSQFFRQNANNIQLTPFRRNLLDYMVRRFFMPLHFPFSDKLQENQLLHYSAKASVEAALDIVYAEPDPHFRQLLTVGGGMFRDGVRYATIAIASEMLTQAGESGTTRGLYHDLQRRELIRGAMRTITDLSMDRVVMGETNIKLPVFLDMFVANADALERDETPDMKIAQSAKERLESCLELLRSQSRALGDASADETMFSTPDMFDGGFGNDWDVGLFFEL